ncbi:MAG: hypothetical protein KGM24_09645 [Elusimicrobia bacterium]|nr:hypothetical protein [Elusimicrobiota bacterium]
MSGAEIEAAQAVPIEAFGLPRALTFACVDYGCATLLDLLTADSSWLLRHSGLGTIAYAKARLWAENYLAGASFLERLARGGWGGLAPVVRALVGAIGWRRGDILARTGGLHSGWPVALREVGAHWGISRERARQLRESAEHLMRWELQTDQPRFWEIMNALYRESLSARQGMACVGEWKRPWSPFYTNERDACVAFAFLCRVCGYDPESSCAVSDGVVCFESSAVAERFQRVMGCVKKTLPTRTKPVRVDDLIQELLARGIADESPEFVRRCLEVAENIRWSHDRRRVVRVARWRARGPNPVLVPDLCQPEAKTDGNGCQPMPADAERFPDGEPVLEAGSEGRGNPAK